ncbi:Mfs1.1 [Auricularia subglabra TFB-10046 SS5]|nr:Mfs1.1 [Auricularia subglabra TFB-10046 SS5]
MTRPSQQVVETGFSEEPAPAALPKRRGAAFWLIFVAMCVSLFQAAFEGAAVGTALPTIAETLKSDEFVWIGTAYSLSSTASLPMMGGLAQAFGRRPAMLGSIFVFALGSVICGAAVNMNMLIAGRTVQGLGGGGILALSSIIVSDLVSLRERVPGCRTWSVAIASAAVSGGSLAEHGQWRWIFYLNLPISAVAFILVFLFLKSKTPKTSLRQKLASMDWIGNSIVIASSTAICIALTWAGVRYSWASAKVLVPLILGLLGLLGFFFYEATCATHPVVPLNLLNNRTSAAGHRRYIATFINPFIVLSATYYLPVYLQACKGDGPVKSGGIDFLGVSVTLGPIGIIAGIVVAVVRKYRPAIWVGWIFLAVGMGLWSTFGKDDSSGKIVGYEVVASLGSGILYTVTYFPVLSPLPVSYNARALAFFAFIRALQVWGITIGATVLQNNLLDKLPAAFTVNLPEGIQIAYSAIPLIKKLEDQALKDEVREAFAASVRVLWRFMIGAAGIGALTTLAMKEVPLHTYTDDDWALQDGEIARPIPMNALTPGSRTSGS